MLSGLGDKVGTREEKIISTTVNCSEKLDLRLTLLAKQKLKSAAATNRSVSDFVLKNSLARADETLTDRPNFDQKFNICFQRSRRSIEIISFSKAV